MAHKVFNQLRGVAQHWVQPLLRVGAFAAVGGGGEMEMEMNGKAGKGRKKEKENEKKEKKKEEGKLTFPVEGFPASPKSARAVLVSEEGKKKHIENSNKKINTKKKKKHNIKMANLHSSISCGLVM